MKKFLTENKSLVILWILCSIALLIFCGHYNNILLDVGREIYYPQQILNGEVLYKDLFNIYGPFSYIFNAFLYKIFGIKLGTLYFSSIICSYLIVSGTYFISRKFLSEFLSISIGIFVIVSGICAPHIFNYTMPYSYGMLYGLVGFIYSILALIKYKQTNNISYFYISSLLCGLCLANKYDFIFYGIFLFILAICTRNKKFILNFITCVMFIPLICALVLFLQKLSINDCINTFYDIKTLINSKSLTYFYTNKGIFFDPRIFAIWGLNIIKTGICFGGLIFGIKYYEKNKILGWIILIFSAISLFVITSPAVFVFLTPLTILLALIFIKNIKTDISIVYLLIGVLCISLKSFFAFITLNYGNYITPVLICAFLSVLFTTLNEKYEKAFAIGLIIVSINTLIGFSINRFYLSGKISTPKGTIYTTEITAIATDSVIAGLEQNKPDKVLIYPEGLIINFLSNTKSSGYYNSLLPIYSESFGDKKFIENIDKLKPEYIILTNLDMTEYGKPHVGDDYAQEVKQYIFDNYQIIDEIGDYLRYIIFKRNI